MNSEVEQFVKGYLIERGASFSEANWQDYDFVASGVIDSFEILSFILELNERYNLRIRPEDFVGADYNRVGKLVAWIESTTDKPANTNAGGRH